jgi:hypothetical protein
MAEMGVFIEWRAPVRGRDIKRLSAFSEGQALGESA